jgi:hypothetical protein
MFDACSILGSRNFGNIFKGFKKVGEPFAIWQKPH